MNYNFKGLVTATGPPDYGGWEYCLFIWCGGFLDNTLEFVASLFSVKLAWQRRLCT